MEARFMRTFNYVVTDKQGIHARPAGELVKMCKGFNSRITISKAGKEADAKGILGVMGLGVKKDEEIIIRAEGDDEDVSINKIETFLKKNL
jgi:phosphocarrier protein